jgi:hypothetical protein
MIDQETVTQALQLIGTRRGVTFVELADLLGDRARGDQSIELPALPNVVLWVGMSDDFIDLVDALQATGQVQMQSTVPLVYLIDGGFPNLPIAKRPPKSGYRQPHWAPVVFNPKTPAGNRRRGVTR